MDKKMTELKKETVENNGSLKVLNAVKNHHNQINRSGIF
jgi:hypothetical protein